MKNLDIAVLIIIALAVLGYLWTLRGEEQRSEEGYACTMEAKMCPDGTAVGRSGPFCEFEECPASTEEHPIDDIQTHIDSKANLITLNLPARDSVVVSPIRLTGEARGYWFFEASFPIFIVDWDGRIIGEGVAEAQSDWMTEEFVPFSATITFDLPEDTPYRRGAIILKKDNPSGLPEHDDALEVPIRF